MLKKIPWGFVSFVILGAQEKDHGHFFACLEQRMDENLQRELLKCSFQANGEVLFRWMKSRGLLRCDKNADWFFARHVDALDWIEPNGIDLTSYENLEEYVYRYPSAIQEHLLTKKGVSVELLMQLLDGTPLEADILRVIAKLKGNEFVKAISEDNIYFDFQCIEFLRSINYDIKRKSCLEKEYGDELYSLLCSQILTFEELNEDQKSNVENYVRKNGVKVCKGSYRFLKEGTKKKIVTFLLCLKSGYGNKIPKELQWNILDIAYSSLK